MTPLNACLSYFGGKRTLAPEIVKLFGTHTLYYDLFCGSCAVLFAKEPCRQEVASEKNPDVVNLLMMLADYGRARELSLKSLSHPCSVRMYEEATERLAENNYGPGCEIYRAFDFLLISWQGPSGLAGTTAKPRFAKRNTASGGSTAARWRSVAESIPAWHERLRNVEFRNQCAFEILEDVPDREGVVVYADPPYILSSRKGGWYVFDFTPEDHERLAEKLNAFRKARVVVSYYGCPETERLYAGWRKIELAAARKMNNVAGGETTVQSAGECVYVRA